MTAPAVRTDMLAARLYVALVGARDRSEVVYSPSLLARYAWDYAAAFAREAAGRDSVTGEALHAGLPVDVPAEVEP